jgi:hypothetical protein
VIKVSGFKGRGLKFDVAYCRAFGVEPICKSVIKRKDLDLVSDRADTLYS